MQQGGFAPEQRLTGFKFRQFLAIARLTALDLVRQPVCLMLTASCVVLMALAAVQAFQFGEDGKFARDSCLAIQFVFGLLAGAYGACTTLSNEIRNGTATVMLSKPVSRALFIAAKFAGLAGFILLFSACAIPACLLSENASPRLYFSTTAPLALLWCAVPAALALAGLANYRLRRQFASTAFWILLLILVAGAVLVSAFHDPASGNRYANGNVYHVGTSMQWRIVPAGLLITMALVTLSGVALALATRLSAIHVIALSAGLLFVGLLSEYLAARIGFGPLAALCRAVIPDWQNFWMTDALNHGGTIPWRYTAIAGVYALCYFVAALAGGILLFRRREMR